MIYKSSKVFGEASMVMEGALKNPNQYRDAVLFESLAAMPAEKITAFINSGEAKIMMEEGMISPEVLDRLVAANEGPDVLLKTTICHMAKENDDPLWDAIVQARMQERKAFNDLLAKYGDSAAAVIESTVPKITRTIPAKFR